MESQPYIQQNEPTSQNIIKNYHLLQSQDSQQRQKANRFLMNLSDHEETWITCQKMIQLGDDPNFIFLGAQLLYQKIEKDLHQFNHDFKIGLKNFIFSELDSGKHQKMFIIDKLASSAALIVCTLFLQEWPLFMQDLLQFMKKSNNHLINGLKILQRIPQQLRSTNRISQGVKNRIQQKFLSQQQLFTIIFNSVFQLNDQALIVSSLKTMQSWIRVCYPIMKYPQLITKVLQISLNSMQLLQISIKVITQGIKLSSQQNCSSGLSQFDPYKQQSKYSLPQIQSIKIIISYSIQNKNNFLSYISIEPEYSEMYLQLIEQLLLSYGFLILDVIGFNLIDIIMEITSSYDLKLSYNTFEFWIDYSEKVSKMKFGNANSDLTQQTINESEIKQKIFNIYLTLFNLFTTGSKKLIISNDSYMYQADLKDDDTIDDAEGMTFTQYRKQAASLLKYIYDFFSKMKKQAGVQIYFKKVVQLLQTDNPPLSKNTQLALYILKAPIQSIIQPHQTIHMINILQYLIIKINKFTNTNVQNNPLQSHSIPTIVLGQTMNFIRDCTREIKQKDYLFLQALKFVLAYINDQKLCHHAAYCFQILMETINTLNDSNIAENLIHFYSQKKFTKQVVLQKILQGIFNAIIKVPNKEKVQSYLDAILITLSKKYMECSKTIVLEAEPRSELYLSLVEIKTILDSYQSSNSQFKHNYKAKFYQLANRSIQIVNQILPMGIQSKLRFSSINEIGLSVSIYRAALKILQVPQNFQIITTTNPQVPSFIISLQMVLTHVLSQKQITQYYYTLTILSQTLIQFINHQNQYLNEWLKINLSSFCSFFVQYYQHIQKVDTDIIKMFFTVMESLVLYNPLILNDRKDVNQPVLTMALHAVRHLNQKNMQRKIISFLSLSLQNLIYSSSQNYQSIIQYIFASIPIVHSMCYTTLAKIFKHLFKNTSIQDKQNVFNVLLQQNPYQQIKQKNIRILLSKALSLAIMTEQQRNIKSIFVQINQIVWKKISNDILMQLELKLATMKRELNKRKQEIMVKQI